MMFLNKKQAQNIRWESVTWISLNKSPNTSEKCTQTAVLCKNNNNKKEDHFSRTENNGFRLHIIDTADVFSMMWQH